MCHCFELSIVSSFLLDCWARGVCVLFQLINGSIQVQRQPFMTNGVLNVGVHKKFQVMRTYACVFLLLPLLIDRLIDRLAGWLIDLLPCTRATTAARRSWHLQQVEQ